MIMKENSKYRLVRHMEGHEANRTGHHIYLLTDSEKFYNFYLPVGLPKARGKPRLALDVTGNCTKDTFYDLEYKKGKLLKEGTGTIEFDKKGFKVFLGKTGYRFIPRKNNELLVLLKPPSGKKE